jgi:putative endonuclease
VHYVYCLTSIADPSRRYIGYTENLRQRIADHNRGCCPATAPFRPWRVKGYIAFDNKPTALAFERYLKTGSGHAFASKRLW